MSGSIAPARSHELDWKVLAYAVCTHFRTGSLGEGVELAVDRRVFQQISDLAVEYKTGARSLRGLFEELITPILFTVPDDSGIKKVEIGSLFAEPRYIRA